MHDFAVIIAGFGFIQPDQGDGEIFVHQACLCMLCTSSTRHGRIRFELACFACAFLLSINADIDIDKYIHMAFYPTTAGDIC